MANYCPKCGECLDTAKKILFCPECGTKQENEFKYCPECGNRLSIDSQSTKKKKTKTVALPKINLPKISIKLPKVSRKYAVSLFLICIVVLSIVGVWIFFPFSFNGTSNSNRTFEITIRNTYSSTIACSLKVGSINYGDEFDIVPGGNTTQLIKEKDLFSKNNNYTITLTATSGAINKVATAENVSEYAIFTISSEGTSFNVSSTEQQ